MFLHETLLRLQTFLPWVRRRLVMHDQHYAPVFNPAFQEDRYAELLVLFCIDRAEGGKPRAARRLLERLEPIAMSGSDAEKALWFVLAGICFQNNAQPDAMVSAFEEAARYGHSFHLPYILTAEHQLLNTHLYDSALENYDRAVNAIYQHPPLNEEKRYVIAQAQAGMALCLTMMHRCDEAREMLARAEIAHDSEEYLHASAFLCAVGGDAEGAARAMAAFRPLNPSLHDHIAGHIRMMLDGTHVHFNVRPAPPHLAEDFWRWFRSQEEVFAPLLAQGDADECGNLLAEHINTLVPDEEDQMYAAIELHDGQPEIILTACYSRSYAAMIDAMAAACPEDIRARWRITIQP